MTSPKVFDDPNVAEDVARCCETWAESSEVKLHPKRAAALRDLAAYIRQSAPPPIEKIAVKRGSVGDPLREQCFRDIQMVVAGHPTASVLAAQVDSLGVTIAFAADDRSHARKLTADLAGDIDKAVDLNWQDIRDQAGSMQREAGHG